MGNPAGKNVRIPNYQYCATTCEEKQVLFDFQFRPNRPENFWDEDIALDAVREPLTRRRQKDLLMSARSR